MRKLLGVCAPLLGLAALANPALGGTIRDDRLDSQYTDLASAYPSVGRFDGTNSQFSFVASGTLIASDWVLTAAHVVDQATSLQFGIGGTTYSADGWQAFPKWAGDPTSGYDIGLAHLSAPVTNVTPAQLYTGKQELGKVATTVGFGLTGTGLTGATTLDGQKRAGDNVVDLLFNRRVLISDFDNPHDAADNLTGSATPLDLEFLSAEGDSGGGVFIDSIGGPLLAGVTSFGSAVDGAINSDYGDFSGSTRVSSFARWINAVMDGKNTRGFVHGPTFGGQQLIDPLYSSQFVALPEPASLSVLSLGGLLLLRRRRA